MSNPKWLSVSDIHNSCDIPFTGPSIRKHIHNARHLDDASYLILKKSIRRIGRRIFIDAELLQEWIEMGESL